MSVKKRTWLDRVGIQNGLWIKLGAGISCAETEKRMDNGRITAVMMIINLLCYSLMEQMRSCLTVSRFLFCLMFVIALVTELGNSVTVIIYCINYTTSMGFLFVF